MKPEEFSSKLSLIDKELHLLQRQMNMAFENFKEMERTYNNKQLEKIKFLTQHFIQLYNLNPNQDDDR